MLYLVTHEGKLRAFLDKSEIKTYWEVRPDNCTIVTDPKKIADLLYGDWVWEIPLSEGTQ